MKHPFFFRLFMAVFTVFVSMRAIRLGAEPVPVDTVVAAARGWLALTEADPLGTALGNGLAFVAPAEDATGKPLYYAVYLENGGALAMAPDDAIEPVIAFTPDGADLDESSPCNHLRMMLEGDLAGRLAEAEKGLVKDAAAKAGKWALLIAASRDPHGVKAGLESVSDVRVSPLTATKWSQTYVYQGSTKLACYNYYTYPYTAGSWQNYYCGCVATALAQLMRFHNYPAKSVDHAKKFYIHIDGTEYYDFLRGGNGTGGKYDWADMPTDPGGLAKAGTLSLTQRMAVGALCHDAGVAVGMSYTAGGSSASMCWSKGDHPLQTVFGYANVDSPWVDATASFARKDINDAINPNLDAGLPCGLSIRNNTSGHAIIVDGYGYAADSLYHHLNLGWGGADTAWYSLPNVGTESYTYFRVSGMLFNLSPRVANLCVISGRILDASGKPVSGARVVAKHTDSLYPNKAAVSNSRGIYALKVLPGEYKLVCTKKKIDFKPARRTVAVGSSTLRNAWSVNFKKTP